MKKRIIYIFMMVMTVAMFTSCSNSDDDKKSDDNSAIAGTWNAAPIVTNGDYFVSGPVLFDWQAAAGTALGKSLGTDNEITVAQAAYLGQSMGSSYLTNLLKSVTFNSDGSISAVYSDFGASVNWKDSGTGYVTFKAVSGANKILVYLNIEKISAASPKFAAFVTAYPAVKAIITGGIPLNYAITSTGLTLYFDQDFINQMTTFLPMVEALMPTEDATMTAVKAYLQDIPTALQATTSIKIGLNFVK